MPTSQVDYWQSQNQIVHSAPFMEMRTTCGLRIQGGARGGKWEALDRKPYDLLLKQMKPRCVPRTFCLNCFGR